MVARERRDLLHDLRVERAGQRLSYLYLFDILGSKKGNHNLASALALAALYTLLFVPFTYYIDRFSYNRYQRRMEQQGQKGAAKKR